MPRNNRLSEHELSCGYGDFLGFFCQLAKKVVGDKAKKVGSNEKKCQ